MALTFWRSRNAALTCGFTDRHDLGSWLRQHMLMAQITESFDEFLARTVRKLVPRLLAIDGELGGQPAQDDAPDLPSCAWPCGCATPWTITSAPWWWPARLTMRRSGCWTRRLAHFRPALPGRN